MPADVGHSALGPAASAVERIWAFDPTLWADDPNTPELGDRLCWLTVLEINPFDQPNMQESKGNTNRLLGEFARAGKLPEPQQAATGDGLELITPDGSGDGGRPRTESLRGFLEGARPGDYLALQGYFTATPEHEAASQRLRLALRDKRDIAGGLGMF